MKVNRVEATASLARMLPSAEGDINAGVLPPNLFINNCPNTVGAFSCLERGLTEEGRGGSVMGKLGDWGGGGLCEHWHRKQCNFCSSGSKSLPLHNSHEMV